MWWLANKEVGHLIPYSGQEFVDNGSYSFDADFNFKILKAWIKFMAQKTTSVVFICLQSKRTDATPFLGLTHKLPTLHSHTMTKKPVNCQQSDKKCCWVNSTNWFLSTLRVHYCSLWTPLFKKIFSLQKKNRKWKDSLGELLVSKKASLWSTKKHKNNAWNANSIKKFENHYWGLFLKFLSGEELWYLPL